MRSTSLSVASGVGGTPETKEKPNRSWTHHRDSQELINQLTIFVSHLKRPLLSWSMVSMYVIVGGYCAILAPHIILLRNFSALIRFIII